MTVYADTSFWFSLLLDERYTEQARSFLNLKSWVITLSRLVELEFVNGLQLRVYRRQMAQPEAALLWSEFLQRQQNGSTILDKNDQIIFTRALEVSRQYSQSTGTRSLDVWHVAFAREKEASCFLSFDKKQRLLAEAVGLKLNPMD